MDALKIPQSCAKFDNLFNESAHFQPRNLHSDMGAKTLFAQLPRDTAAASRRGSTAPPVVGLRAEHESAPVRESSVPVREAEEGDASHRAEERRRLSLVR